MELLIGVDAANEYSRPSTTTICLLSLLWIGTGPQRRWFSTCFSCVGRERIIGPLCVYIAKQGCMYIVAGVLCRSSPSVALPPTLVRGLKQKHNRTASRDGPKGYLSGKKHGIESACVRASRVVEVW